MTVKTVACAAAILAFTSVYLQAEGWAGPSFATRRRRIEAGRPGPVQGHRGRHPGPRRQGRSCRRQGAIKDLETQWDEAEAGLKPRAAAVGTRSTRPSTAPRRAACLGAGRHGLQGRARRPRADHERGWLRRPSAARAFGCLRKNAAPCGDGMDGTMRVLLVEDDRMIGAALQQALRDAAYAVDWVRDGASAQDATATEAYDIVLLDLGLPGDDGMSVLRRLRTNGATMPVIIVTARDGLDDRIGGLDVGADDYVRSHSSQVSCSPG